MTTGLFITGTDTGVGKTLVTCALSCVCRDQGLSVQAMKPLASGCEPDASGELRNADAELMLQYGSGQVAYRDINPYAFAEPIAPHIAAARTGTAIDLEVISTAYAQLAQQHDWVLVEGVGGWRVPLSETQSITDLVQVLQLPVVLVVGLRLGCLSHALLSYEAIIADGHRCVGWIGSQVEAGMASIDDNVTALQQRIDAPLLGILPCLVTPDPRAAAKFVRLPDLTV